jgi:sulfide:quinone oxidoreductase
MDIRKIDERFSVTGQISVEDVPAIAAAGFKAIVCNRPDLEGFDQPPHMDLKDAAAKAGLSFVYIPVAPGAPIVHEPMEMAAFVQEASGPVLGYCRSGARSANLYALAFAATA